MTVKELMAELAKYDGEMLVLIDEEGFRFDEVLEVVPWTFSKNTGEWAFMRDSYTLRETDGSGPFVALTFLS